MMAVKKNNDWRKTLTFTEVFITFFMLSSARLVKSDLSCREWLIADEPCACGGGGAGGLRALFSPSLLPSSPLCFLLLFFCPSRVLSRLFFFFLGGGGYAISLMLFYT